VRTIDTESTATAQQTQQPSLRLTIQNPASFLNHISERYISVGRIIMEFIDNALDDAEADFRENHFAYSQPVEVKIVIDRVCLDLLIYTC
jgi:hypothetical protein